MKKILAEFCVLSVFLFLISCPFSAKAFQVEKIADLPITGDFVLSQTKVEVQLEPGEKDSRSLSLTNRSGADLAFSVHIEDFSASVKPEQNIDLLGSQTGLYSLKDYLKPEVSSFTLHHGEKITLPVAINIPPGAQPGGLYGAVIFSVIPSAANQAGTAGNVQVVPRLASLFFVRVKGEAAEAGELLDFTSSKTVYFGGPIGFEFNYKNTGNVYLNPYGELKITDVFGREVYAKWISPYFVMPGAIRQQKESPQYKPFLGMYRATLKLNRGYGNQLDQKSLYFFVLPIWQVAIIVAALILLVWLGWRIRFFLKRNNKSSINDDAQV